MTEASISRLEPYTTVRVSGRVASTPGKIKGGHLIFALSNGRTTVDCTIYEPAKGFRKIGSALMPGDRLTLFGGVRERPGSGGRSADRRGAAFAATRFACSARRAQEAVALSAVGGRWVRCGAPVLSGRAGARWAGHGAAVKEGTWR